MSTAGLQSSWTKAARSWTSKMEEAQPLLAEMKEKLLGPDHNGRADAENFFYDLDAAATKYKAKHLSVEARWMTHIANVADDAARAVESQKLQDYLESDLDLEEMLSQAEENLVKIARLFALRDKQQQRADDERSSASERRPATAPPTPSLASPAGDAAIAGPAGNCQTYMALPKMALPSFNGDPCTWPAFASCFEWAVRSSPLLPPLAKLAHLKSSLVGNAASALEGFSLDNESFDAAWAHVVSRYGNKEVRYKAVYEKLTRIKSPGESPADALRHLDHLTGLIQQGRHLDLDPNNLAIHMAVEASMPRWMDNLLTSARLSAPEWDTTTLIATASKLAALAVARAPAPRELKKSAPATTMSASSAQPAAPRNPKKPPPRTPAPPAGSSQRLRSDSGQHPASPKARRPKEPPLCFLCQKSAHWAAECPDNPTLEARRLLCLQQGRCLRCIRKGHDTATCRSAVFPCRNCRDRDHHALFCPKPRRPPEASTTAVAVTEEITVRPTPDTTASAQQSSGSNRPHLMVAPVRVRHPTSGQEAQTWALLDSGSNRSYASTALQEALGLQSLGQESLTVNVFGGGKVERVFYRAEMELLLDDGTLKVETYCAGAQLVGAPLSTQLLDDRRPIRKAKIVSKTVLPSLLLGAPAFWRIVRGRSDSRHHPEHWIIDTGLGPLVQARTADESPSTTLLCLTAVDSFLANEAAGPHLDFDSSAHPDAQIRQQVSDWLQMDNLGLADLTGSDDELAWEAFRRTVAFDGQRYVVSLPRKLPLHPLQSYLGLAVTRLCSLLNKPDPQKRRSIREAVRSQIDTWLDEGKIEVVPADEVETPKYGEAVYHPYHLLAKKARMVHNASASARGHGSLNDALYRGPVILPELLGMWLRFRSYSYVAIGDIRAAFLQLALHLADRDLLRFLAPKDWNRPCGWDNLVHYRFLRVNFGLVCAAFLLAACLWIHFQAGEHPFDHAALSNSYVDNFMAVDDTLPGAIARIEHYRLSLSRASMELRDIVSSDADTNRRLYPGANADQCMLGTKWNTTEDVIILIFHPILPDASATKRSVASAIARHFDPSGLLSPALVAFKEIIRLLWELHLGWDDPLPPAVQQLLAASNRPHGVECTDPVEFRLPRTVLPRPLPDTDVVLHVFVDASKVALGVCCYLTLRHCAHVPRLLMAKSRLAPPNATIPRLELSACSLGTRVARNVVKEGRPISECRIWTDSSAVLGWLAGSLEGRPSFVTARIDEIWQFRATFGHVSTEQNPADLASRGLHASLLRGNSLWWHGPGWLATPENDWPTPRFPYVEINPDAHPPKKPQPAPQLKPWEIVGKQDEGYAAHAVPCTSSDEAPPDQTMDVTRFSSWNRLLDATIRFLLVLRLWLSTASIRCRGQFSRQVLAAPEGLPMRRLAHQRLLMEAQARHPPSKKQCLDWSLRLSSDGLWRRHSRLPPTLHGSCPEPDPVWLPRDDELTALLLRWHHERLQHASIATTLSALRAQYYIPQGRRAARTAISQCFQCRRSRMIAFRLPDPPCLPTQRVSCNYPFESLGADLAGPFRVFGSASQREPLSVHIALFTCLVTRAVHLEIVHSTSAIDFIRAIRRFAARHGFPQRILTDNASGFRVARLAVHTLLAPLDEPVLLTPSPLIEEPGELHVFLEKIDVQWRHIPQLSPWQGGAYERMVGLVKNSLRRVVGKKMLLLDEFATLVAEAEAVVNLRPLTYLSDDARVIRPADFLRSGSRPGLPLLDDEESFDPEATSTALHLSTQWRHEQQRLLRLWDDFRRDYLSQLRDRPPARFAQSRHSSPRFPQLGEVVLVHDDNVNRYHWRWAVITGLHEGSDHCIRSADIRFGNGRVSRRSTALLYPLEERGYALAPPAPAPASPGPSPPPVTDSLRPSDNGPREPAAYNLRPRRRVKYAFFALLLLGLFLPATTALPDVTSATVARSRSTPQPRYSDACQAYGVIIWEKDASSFVVKDIDCQPRVIRSHLDPRFARDKCQDRCSCPNGTDDCSIPLPALGQHDPETLRLVEALSPALCRTPRPSCSSPVTRHLTEVELLDGHKVLLDQPSISRRQELETHCFGDGSITGTPLFCAHHQCTDNGTRFCVMSRSEVAFLQIHPGIEARLRAWSTRPYDVFVTTDPPQQLPCKDEAHLTCTPNGLRVLRPPACVSVLEICVSNGISHDCAHHDQLPPDAVLSPPDPYLLVPHTFRWRSWSQGALIRSDRLDCPASELCEFIDSWRASCLLSNLVHLTISGLACTIILFVAVFIFRQCWRRRRHIVKPRGATLRWAHDHRLLHLAVFALVSLAHGSGFSAPADGCAQSISFQAEEHKCSIPAEGTVSCQFNQISQLTVRHGTTGCIRLQDPEGHVVGLLQIRVFILQQCRRQALAFTRSAVMRTITSKRCPAMGSCSEEDACANIQGPELLPEFKGVSHLAGYTSCRDGCSGITCGCALLRPACVFARHVVEARSPDIYRLFRCDWIETVHLSWTLNEHSVAFFLRPGESAAHFGIHIAHQGASVHQRPPPQARIASAGNRSWILDRAAWKAASLLRCPTPEAALQMNNLCHVDQHVALCHLASETVICEVPTPWVDQGVELPAVSHGLLLRAEGQDVVAETPGAVTLQIAAEGFRHTTILSRARCDLIDAQLSGCYACSSGAVLHYRCHSSNGRQHARLVCGEHMDADLICDDQGTPQDASVSFDSAAVDIDCHVICPDSNQTKRIRGRLDYVDHGDRWETCTTTTTTASLYARVWDLVLLSVTDYLPMAFACFAALLLLPRFIRFLARLLMYA